MAIDYIEIDDNLPLGLHIRRVQGALIQARDGLRFLKETVDHMAADPTYTDIETQSGAATGKGDDIYNLITNAKSEIDADTNVVNFIAQIFVK